MGDVLLSNGPPPVSNDWLDHWNDRNKPYNNGTTKKPLMITTTTVPKAKAKGAM